VVLAVLVVPVGVPIVALEALGALVLACSSPSR
jgi:hypothetical protein